MTVYVQKSKCGILNQNQNMTAVQASNEERKGRSGHTTTYSISSKLVDVSDAAAVTESANASSSVMDASKASEIGGSTEVQGAMGAHKSGVTSGKSSANNSTSLVQAKEITSFCKRASAGITGTKGIGEMGDYDCQYQTKGQQQIETEGDQQQMLQAFTSILDEDGGKSLDNDAAIAMSLDEREVEERAVVDFVSEIELNHGSIKLRGVAADQDGEEGETMNNRQQIKKDDGEEEGKLEEEELSQQCSLDDVSDDDEQEVDDGDEQQRQQVVGGETVDQFQQQRASEGNETTSSKQDYQQKCSSVMKRNSLAAEQQQKKEIDSRDGAQPTTVDSSYCLTSNHQGIQQSSTNDSTTNRDSSSSNHQSKEGVVAATSSTNAEQQAIYASNVTSSVVEKKTHKVDTADLKLPLLSSKVITDKHATKVEESDPVDDKANATSSQAQESVATVSQNTGTNTNIANLKQSTKKVEPLLDKENYVKGHFQKFLAHVETRVMNKGVESSWPEHQQQNKGNEKQSAKITGGRSRDYSNKSGTSSNSSSSKSDDSDEANKDNEDPNATVAVKADQFDPKEMRQAFDGWSLYKKMRISFAPVRRYQMMVDQDYKKNKVTVCAHLQNIFTSYCVKRGKATYQMNNYFDIDKWINKMSGNANSNNGNSPTKELKRTNTIGNMMNSNADDQDRVKENYLLTKTNSTAHIPESIRAKNSKRAYANFDKDLAVKMFGYRVIFKKKKMEIAVPDPHASQNHKPLQRFVNDIIGELSQQYVQIPRFHTKQLILMPLPDNDEDMLLQDEIGSVQGDGGNVNASNQNDYAAAGADQDHQPQQDAAMTPVESSGISTPNCEGAGKTTSRADSACKRIRQIRKYGGEIVNLKTKHGERQNFLKKTRNLLWHCAPIERLQSANSYQKRGNFASKGATHSSIYGQSSINQSSSPTRTNSISPKKPLGWNQSNVKQTPQTQNNTIKMMQQVRYANPRNGTLHPPGQNGSNSIRFQSNGAGNQNFNNYRRQNSYRKGQRPVRVDSAKGGRPGIRQSMESNCNPAYRLINQPTAFQSSSDQNFIMNGANINSMQDSEVAQITAGNASTDNQQNVVHLKDPKLIEGFGSNVVHVNVSCGQTLPDASHGGKNSQPQQQKAESRNKNNIVEDDEDAQTFIIQLTEEQTRQLADGTLKLNGVPIPKDLSNLNYDQIMALLDSVNLPPQKGAPKVTAPKQPNAPSQQPPQAVTSQGHTSFLQGSSGSPIGTKSQLQEQKYASEGRKTYQQPFSTNNTTAAAKYSTAYNQGGKSAGNHYLGQTYSGNTSNCNAFYHINNTDMFRKQHTQYSHNNNNNTNILQQIEQQNYMKQQTMSCKAEPQPNIKTVKHGRDLVRQSQGRQQSSRLESAQRRNRQSNRHQAASYGSTKHESDLKMQINGTQQQRSNNQQYRQHRGPQNHSKMSKNGANQHTATSASGGSVTANGAGQGGPNSVIHGRNGTSNKVTSGNIMGGSEWDMLAMLSQQQQQLKNAQQFLQQNTTMNLEHARKMQAMTTSNNTVDSSMINDVYALNGNRSKEQQSTTNAGSMIGNHHHHHSTTTGAVKQDAFNNQQLKYHQNISNNMHTSATTCTATSSRANNADLSLFHRTTIGSIQANTIANTTATALNNNGGHHTSTNFNNTVVSSSASTAGQQHHQANTSSQQMIQTIQQTQQNGVVGANTTTNGFNYIRMVHPGQQVAPTSTGNSSTVGGAGHPVQKTNSHNSTVSAKQKSMTRLSSKKRISDGRSGATAAVTNSHNVAGHPMQHSSSRGFLKNPNTAGAMMQNSHHHPQFVATHQAHMTQQQQSARVPNGHHSNSIHNAQQNLLLSQQAALQNANMAAAQTSASHNHHAKHVMVNKPSGKHQQTGQYGTEQSEYKSASVHHYHHHHHRGSKDGVAGGVNNAINRYYKSAQGVVNNSLMTAGPGGITNGGNTTTKSNLNNYSSMATVQNQSTAAATQSATDHHVKSLSTKNQMSKTSIELEYSKFESSSNGGNVPAGAAKQVLATKVVGGPGGAAHLGAKVLSSIQQQSQQQQQQQLVVMANSSATATSSVVNHSRKALAHANGSVLEPPTQQLLHQSNVNNTNNNSGGSKGLRINQHTLNNNLNYANQSSTHKRKIESALAQSAINAIQSQNGNHVGLQIGPNSQNNHNNSSSLQTGSKNTTLQFEQKALSQQCQIVQQPASQHHDTVMMQYHHQHGSISSHHKVGVMSVGNNQHNGNHKASEQFRTQSNTMQPPFIMRNPQQI